jgi:hypothetical protein
MTALLEKALSRVNALPPEGQDALASLILEEIESEKKWDELFAGTQSQMSRSAEQAIAGTRQERRFHSISSVTSEITASFRQDYGKLP